MLRGSIEECEGGDDSVGAGKGVGRRATLSAPAKTWKEAPNGKWLGRSCLSEPLPVSVRAADWRRYQDGRLGIIHPILPCLSVHSFICVLVSAFGVHSFTARRGAWECKPGKLLCLGLNLGSALSLLCVLSKRLPRGPFFVRCLQQTPADIYVILSICYATFHRELGVLVSFVSLVPVCASLTKTGVTMGRGTSVEELLPSDWPVAGLWGPFWLM